MSALVHYLTGPGAVACDMPWSVVSTVTENRSVVTCGDCQRVILAAPVPLPEHMRQSSPRATLRRIRQILDEYDRGVHTEADALSMIRALPTINELIDKEGPGDGKD